eukprot:c3518_g1_i1.p1 GENE.c3518_g1_i1~~c3518_g1_i1.p1  ORF type:complete len:147 (+),score=34.05 c3518_g1_i1:32-472(+)
MKVLGVVVLFACIVSEVMCANPPAPTAGMGTRPSAFDMSGLSLPVVKSFLQSPDADKSDPTRSILPLMMMMSQRKHGYRGMGYVGGVYGLGPSSSPFGFGGPSGMGMGMNPYSAAIANPLYQAHLMNSNPFLNPAMNPFIPGPNGF